MLRERKPLNIFFFTVMTWRSLAPLSQTQTVSPIKKLQPKNQNMDSNFPQGVVEDKTCKLFLFFSKFDVSSLI